MKKSLLFLILCLLYVSGEASDKHPPKATSQTPITIPAPSYDYGDLLAQVLQSGMVIQQGKPFTLWGNAPAGGTVAVEADWTPRAETIADANGVWRLAIPVPTITRGKVTPHTLTIRSGNQSRRLEDLLFGEVWLLSGQSNMSMCMEPFQPWHNGVSDFAQEIASADYPNLRLYLNPKNSSEQLNNISEGRWMATTPETVARFSAVGYYFARKIHIETGFPVGIVVTALGSMACECFTPAEALVGDPFLKERFWDPWQVGDVTALPKKPAHLYNGMIHPFLNLSIRGFGWYQGESNAGHIDSYDRLCTAMVTSWRERFAQGELPFYCVMVVPYSWKSTNINKISYCNFRETQVRFTQTCPKTDIATAMDCGEFNCVHPSAKKPVGERMAALALHHDYGVKGVYKGMQFQGMKIYGNKVTINYNPSTIGSGLITSDGKPVEGFYLAGENQIFFKATAKIIGDSVVLSSHKVAKPVAVRYAFLAYVKTNLQNREGFAADPFRTDNWSKAKYYVHK